jgi:hypothetical protein
MTICGVFWTVLKLAVLFRLAVFWSLFYLKRRIFSRKKKAGFDVNESSLSLVRHLHVEQAQLRFAYFSLFHEPLYCGDCLLLTNKYRYTIFVKIVCFGDDIHSLLFWSCFKQDLLLSGFFCFFEPRDRFQIDAVLNHMKLKQYSYCH